MRLDKSRLTEVKQKVTAPIIVPIEINSEAFDVVVGTRLDDTMRAKIGKGIQLFSEASISTYGEEVLSTLLIFMVTTDIAWSFELEEDMETLTLLLSSGAAKTILEAVPETLIHETVAYMGILQKAAEELLEEQKLQNKSRKK